MSVPKEYEGREQSYLKHRVLTEYLTLWAHKLGSISSTRRDPVRLWYVDCFAGPWQARDEALRDTSIAIGLNALTEAAETWAQKGMRIDICAIFIEKDPEAFGRLCDYVEDRKRGDARLRKIQARRGAFEDHLTWINDQLGDDPAFIFVDPTGWTGAAMRFIGPLLRHPRRDVLVNVMFNHINRFKDDQRAFLRAQMRDFFGLDDAPSLREKDEEGLVAFYREQLKRTCGLRYAADLAIRHPTHERTWFRLVVGGAHGKVLEVFRDVERAVVDGEMPQVREAAKRRRRESRTAQTELLLPTDDRSSAATRGAQIDGAWCAARVLLEERPALRFDALWPPLLEQYHVTKRELAHALWQRYADGEIAVFDEQGAPIVTARRRTVHDGDVVRLISADDVR